MKKLIFLMLFCFAASVSASSWTGNVIVEEIYPSLDTQSVLFKFTNMQNPTECNGFNYYILKKDNLMFEQLFALLMSAQARKSSVNVRLHGCGGNNNEFPLIYTLISQ